MCLFPSGKEEEGAVRKEGRKEGGWGCCNIGLKAEKLK
jgi:hypothetical protein